MKDKEESTPNSLLAAHQGKEVLCPSCSCHFMGFPALQQHLAKAHPAVGTFFSITCISPFLDSVNLFYDIVLLYIFITIFLDFFFLHLYHFILILKEKCINIFFTINSKIC